MPAIFRLFPLVTLALLIASCGPDLKPGVAEAYADLPDKIDFNFHVKPILSDRCYACHGPDAQNQQADLRLDNAEGAYPALTSGNGYAIVPGSAAKSQMILRINSEDPNLMMPTPESNLTLTDEEIALLTKWVEQGAEYKEHWAFTAPQKPAVPAAGKDWTKNEVDHFVAGMLEQKNIQPAPEAEREYLIRRVYYDLNGLPPTTAELDNWLTDERTDWYEQLVDDLLARPAYGERMAMYWMDVARFADSEGYLDDFHHEMWPYRDWVIKAYNNNLPYDDFIEWQIGGDLLDGATTDQVLATAFNRTHKQNSEGGVIPEEFRVEYVADRANTVGTAFMGLTVGCARCHDHKYDPISQKDYFELFGFFNNTVERGDAIFALNALEDGSDIANALSMNAGPTLPLPDSQTARIYAHLKTMIAEQETLLQRPDIAPATAPGESELRKTLSTTTVHHLNFDQEPIRDLATGKNVFYAQPPLGKGLRGKAPQLGEGMISSDGTASRFEHSEPFTVSFWVKPGQFQADALILFNSNSKNQGMRGWETRLDSNRLVVKLSHAYPFQSLALRSRDTMPSDEWTHFTWSYEGSSKAAGMRLYRNGERTETEVLRDHIVRSSRPYLDRKPLVYEGYSGLAIGSRHYSPSFPGGSVDELRVLNAEAGDVLAQYIYCSDGGRGRRCNEETNKQGIAEYHRLHRDAEQQAVRQKLTDLRTHAITTIDTVQEIMVMGDDVRQRPTYILERGVYDAHGEPVNPGVPEALLDWPDDLPRNRLGLGQWLTHPDNPLTARVAVNQLWYLMFGRGIVESVEDFGNQGSLPSHPDLLDWLAVDFRDNGWDVKRLVRQMVTSATYRQSSVIRPELEEIDPDNHLLARGPRYRRSAEMIRDGLLAASGLLDDKTGGKSVFPYQPQGLWREASNHGFSPTYNIDTAGGIYRRSLYTFWKRNAPAPAMLVFDASTRSECQVRRQRSNTPLQALVLLNDPMTIEACRVLAASALAETNDPARATDDVFRRLIGRAPTGDEKVILSQFYEEELTYFHEHPLAAQDFLKTGFHPTNLDVGEARVAALARVANTVLNSTEGYYKN